MKDIFNKEMEIGHIIAVRYVWNSYIGVLRADGLSMRELAQKHWAMAECHPIESKNTHQILGHVEANHKDFNQSVYDWAYSDDGNFKCPVEIFVYWSKEDILQLSRKLKIESLDI
jgi:hypothetical protein